MSQAATDTEKRPPGWHEAIAAALRAAPEPSQELCEKVAGLLLGAINEQH